MPLSLRLEYVWAPLTSDVPVTNDDVGVSNGIASLPAEKRGGWADASERKQDK